MDGFMQAARVQSVHSILYCIIASVSLALCLCACGNEEDERRDRRRVDVVTSASPGHDSSLLTISHAGLKNPACFSCHEDVHLGGFTNGQCVTCHGSNGAPHRGEGHHNANCRSCHQGVHTNLEFYADQDCTACHKYEPGITCPVTEDYDVVVIGAGGGGLSAAATLAKAGMNVVVIEKNYRVGGYMTRFHRGDYSFEASLHALNKISLDNADDSKGTKALYELGLADSIQLVRADPMYRAIFPDITIDVPADIEKYEELLKNTFPAEAGNIEALFQEMDNVVMIVNAVTGLASGFNWGDLLTLIIHPGASIRTLLYINSPLKKMVERYIQDQKVIGIWEQLVFYLGIGPKDLQALYFLIMWNSYHNSGFYYVIGGSQAISDALAKKIVEHGGKIKLNTLATKIVIENGKATQVRTENDACFNARYVVSNANAPDTLLKMIGEEHLPVDYVEQLRKMEIGAATFQVFLGVDHDYRSYFPKTHEIFVNETFDQDESYQYTKEAVLEKVPLVITNYTVVDPTTAPEGKNTIVMTTYLPYSWQNTWHWKQGYKEYTEIKDEVGQVLVRRAEKVLPGLSENVEWMEFGSPVTNYAYCLNPEGAVYGWAHTPQQGTFNRLSMQTPIENVVLAGAWTYPGGGQAPVIQSGGIAASMILGKEK